MSSLIVTAQLHIISSFTYIYRTCLNVTLEEWNEFEIQENDVIGSCVSSDMPQLVTSTRTEATRVYRGPAQCAEFDTTNPNAPTEEISFGLFSQVSATLHLQAIISKYTIAMLQSPLKFKEV